MAGDEALRNENYEHAVELYHLSKVISTMLIDIRVLGNFNVTCIKLTKETVLAHTTLYRETSDK